MNENYNGLQDFEKKAVSSADSVSDEGKSIGSDGIAAAKWPATDSLVDVAAPAIDGEEERIPTTKAPNGSDAGDFVANDDEDPDSTDTANSGEPDPPIEVEVFAPQPKELTREELFQLELEELARQHEKDVARNVELAKDPSLYDTYHATQAKTNEKIKIFSARRRGRSHLMGNTPCQDYCLVADTNRGVILTDADGVGSCRRSDVGSRMACEVTIAFIQELDRQCETEEQLVTRLCSLRFRELLVKRWMQAILTHARENPDETVSSNKIYELYGSTLMFAVMTENYYVVGNLGDGQILLFNEFEGFKLRLHPPKEDTKVRALAHSNCYREDFQVDRYSRKEFSGVLLTTDGMYDVLNSGNLLYQYARQLESRFLEAGEPLQPFCFVEGTQPPKDLFSHRTKDDCSLVLAVDTAFSSDGLDSRIATMSLGVEEILPYRRSGDVACYWMEKNQELYYGVVTPDTEGTVDPDELPAMQGIRLIMPVSSYHSNGYCYSIYADTQDHTLDELYHYSILREQTERTPNASQTVLRVYNSLLRCKRLLREHGYALTAAAPHLMRFAANGEVLLPAKAVMPIAQADADDTDQTERYFASLAGKIVSDDGEYPVFRLGFLNMGQRMFLAEYPQDPAYRVFRDAEGAVWLMNLGSMPWYAYDGVIAPQEKIPLKEGLTFSISAANGELVTYRYVSKEEMETWRLLQ